MRLSALEAYVSTDSLCYPSMTIMNRSGPLEGVLNRILRTGKEIKDLTHRFEGQNAVTPPTAILGIVLPDPPSIYPELLSLQLSSCVAETLSQRYLRAANELRSRAESTIHKTCENLAMLPSTPGLISSSQHQRNLLSTYQDLYIRVLDTWRQEIVQLVQAHNTKLHHSKPSCRSNSTSRHPFNPVTSGYFFTYEIKY